MKKTISIIAIAAMMCTSAAPVFAADTDAGIPDVFVNSSKITFEDQPAVIVDGRTLVPARGVFEAMGMKVDWDAEKRQVEIESADGNTIIRLVIDDPDMKTYDMSGLFQTLLMGQDFVAPETVVELDVAPQIISDRTMIPLRAIGEAAGADVKWDEEAYAVKITTADAPTPEALTSKATYSLSASAETVNEGETVDIFVNVANLPADSCVSTITALVEYNKENFTFENATLVNGDTDFDGVINVCNPDYEENAVKVILATVEEENMVKEDGKIAKLTFKSINGGEGSFALINSYSTTTGYESTLVVEPVGESANLTTYDGNKLYVDTTPVTVNAAE